MDKPNWRKWRLMPDVKVWEACVLSVGLEPSKMHAEDFGWMDDRGNGPYLASECFPNVEIKEEYQSRFEALSANLFNREYFSAGEINGNGRGFCSIRLDEFADWAISTAEWLDLPPELASMAKPNVITSLSTLKSDAALADSRKVSPQNNAGQANPIDSDVRYLASSSSLLNVFGNYGLTKAKLNNLNSHLWLKDARKLLGRGGRHGREAMYCPYEVMQGIVKKSKSKKLLEKRGWELLEQYFSVAYSKFEQYDSRRYDE